MVLIQALAERTDISMMLKKDLDHVTRFIMYNCISNGTNKINIVQLYAIWKHESVALDT